MPLLQTPSPLLEKRSFPRNVAGTAKRKEILVELLELLEGRELVLACVHYMASRVLAISLDSEKVAGDPLLFSLMSILQLLAVKIHRKFNFSGFYSFNCHVARADRMVSFPGLLITVLAYLLLIISFGSTPDINAPGSSTKSGALP
ncbi:hypothetical protein B0H13DRAFT_1936603 [Mycena leptocephala]|nr:hypothetical protein B0H13DRAFT_1936603 [Mycena leptocephala]